MRKIKDFYIRNKQNLIRNIIMRISLSILILTITEKAIIFLFEDNKPNVFLFTKSESFVLTLFSTQGIIVALFAVLVLFLMDYSSQKKHGMVKSCERKNK